jgi:5-formyltetrahydrofolate cyclo-ligase
MGAPDPPDRGARLAAAVLTHPGIEPLLRPGSVATAYVSVGGEPPTTELRRRLRARGITVYLPATAADRRLAWVPDPGDDADAWGLPGRAPASGIHGLTSRDMLALQPSLLVLPALAATPDGRRLGQGGGYYDTFLAMTSTWSAGGPLRVALVGPGELLDDLPTAPHDARVDVAVCC